MAKLSSIEKNNKRKRMVVKYAERRAELKAVIKDKKRSIVEKFQAQLKLAALPRDSSRTRVRNRCELSGRARGYYRVFKLSRIWLRALATSGELPGVSKASW